MRRSEAGMTLVEMLVGIVLATIILGTATTAFVGNLKRSSEAEKHANAQDAVRVAIDQMSIQLRSATSTSTGKPIESFSSYDLVWLAPSQSASTASNPLGLMHVRYCLDNATPSNEALWLQTAPYDTGANANPPSTTACPSSAWSTKTQVASGLVNRIKGVDAATGKCNLTLTAPPNQSCPLFIAQTEADGVTVTDVGIDALVDSEPGTANRTPGELRDSVTLRNLNHKPAGSLTCQASNGHALCDASASTDQDSQTLGFAWKVDGSTVSETSYRLDQGGFTAGTTHTFTVTVTDTGGLSDTKSYSLLIQ